LPATPARRSNDTVPDPNITVFLADDSLLVREGVRALLNLQPDLEVIGVAEDYDGVLSGCDLAVPNVLVTDIRMPPSFQSEGIEAARLVRMKHPGIGVVVLSQFDEPEYAIALLADGAAGYAYLLKDRVGDGDQLVRAVREVATGGSMLDPAIVNALVSPVRADGDLTADEDQLLQWIAEGRPVKAISAASNIPPEAEARIPQSDGSSLMTALNEGLGLKLDSTREDVTVVVVDSVEAPTAD